MAHRVLSNPWPSPLFPLSLNHSPNRSVTLFTFALSSVHIGVFCFHFTCSHEWCDYECHFLNFHQFSWIYIFHWTWTSWHLLIRINRSFVIFCSLYSRDSDSFLKNWMADGNVGAWKAIIMFVTIHNIKATFHHSSAKSKFRYDFRHTSLVVSIYLIGGEVWLPISSSHTQIYESFYHPNSMNCVGVKKPVEWKKDMQLHQSDTYEAWQIQSILLFYSFRFVAHIYNVELFHSRRFS